MSELNLGQPHQPSDPDLAREKLALEVRKLRAEVRHLRLPNLGWITALIATLAGVAGLSFEWSSRWRRYQELTIKMDKVGLDVIRLEMAKERLDTIVRLTKTSLDSLQRRVEELQARHAAMRTSLPASDRRSAARLDSAILQTTSLIAQASDTLEIVQAEVASAGGISPGTPVLLTLELPDQSTVTYRRWISRNVISSLGTLGPGPVQVRLPYGGYLYLEAKSLVSGTVTKRAADCSHGCAVSFE